MWWPGRFQTASRGQVLVFFYRHSTRMYLMKEKQGGPIPTGLKRWPLKLIKHLADTACASPSPAGPTGCCSLNFLYLINLKFWVRAPNGYGSKSNPLCKFKSLGRNPGSAPASTILFYLHGPAHMGPIWNPVALPIWVPILEPYGSHGYRLLARFMLSPNFCSMKHLLCN